MIHIVQLNGSEVAVGAVAGGGLTSKRPHVLRSVLTKEAGHTAAWLFKAQCVFYELAF